MIHFSPRWLSLLCIVLHTCISFAQDTTPGKFLPIRQRMQQFIDQADLSGAVVAVGSSKGLIYLDAIGQRNLDKELLMEKDTLFRIASMTKPITALGIMILAEEGKLSVTDLVEKHLPEFKGQLLVTGKDRDTLTLRKPSRPITIHDLLTHTSGLKGDYGPGLGDLYTKRSRTLAETTLVISQRPLDFEPGSRWSYCNPGIDTLGRIIEVVSGQSYESFLHERIFRPLNMHNTTFYPTQAQLQRTALTYDKKSGKLTPAGSLLIEYQPGVKHPIPAGGLFSTANDLAKLYQMMLRGGVVDSRRILSEKNITLMTQLQTGDLKTGFVEGMGFGYGWAVVREPKGVTSMLSTGTYGHGGAFGTQAWIDPKKDLYFILLIQRTGLLNADDSPMRNEFQRLATEALKMP